MNQSTQIKGFFEVFKGTLIKNENYGKCYKCKQPYISEEKWCNDCDTERYKFFYKHIFKYLKMKKFEELSSNERLRFKRFGLCGECFQPFTGMDSCNDCESKRYNIEYDIEFKKYKENNELEKQFDFKMKKFEELSSNERSRFKQFGLCYQCYQPYIETEWCNNCDGKRFLEESKSIGYANELSRNEENNFKRSGFCHNCKQIKTEHNSCYNCLVKNYGKCSKCSRPYTPEENYGKWCDICDTNLFLEVSKKTIRYFKQPTKLSKDRKEQLDKYRELCSDCEEPNTGWAWCNKCDPGRFLRDGKTSGNTEMDKLIHESQCRAEHYHHNLEWISFDRFKDINQIGEGGFAKVYSATWLDGRPKVLDGKKSRSNSIIIALKEIKNSNNMTNIFINEIKTHYKFQRFYNDSLIQFYGITKDPKTENFMLVLEYADNGSIKDYIKSNYLNLKWKDKLNILYCTSKNLQTIHKLQYVHRDLHSGNVVNFILPYIAPEILNGKPYTTASDIYSFGIIM
ncbi:kinase-like domain-containing protein, partial [Glomus cerebriforme]